MMSAEASSVLEGLSTTRVVVWGGLITAGLAYISVLASWPAVYALWGPDSGQDGGFGTNAEMQNKHDTLLMHDAKTSD